MSDRTDVSQVLDACRNVVTQLRTRVTSEPGGWFDWVPITWQAQSEALSNSSADALSLARYGLSRTATASALGALRFVAETRCLIDWLLDLPSARTSRSLGLALREISDCRRNLSATPKDPDAKADFDRFLRPGVEALINELDDLDRRVRDRAASTGTEPELPPKTLQAQMDKLFQDDTAYRLFSDLGSHVGLGLAYIVGAPDDPRRESRDILLRAFCLGFGVAVQLEIAELVADALGQVGAVSQIRSFRDGYRDLLERVVARGYEGGLFAG